MDSFHLFCSFYFFDHDFTSSPECAFKLATCFHVFCSGWCFNGRGECTHIPQAPDAASKSTACSSSRSKIQAFPTLKAHGLLWVWPDDAPTAWDDAAAEDPVIGGVSGPDASWLATFNFPTTYATFIENVVDPTHVLYVHHGQKFEKGKVFAPEKAIPMSDFKTVGKISAKGGFKLLHAPFTTDDEWSSTTNTFRPPCSSSVETVYPDGRPFSTFCSAQRNLGT